MDILYRLFYTTFSMSVMLLAVLPVVLVLRLAFGKLPRKFSMVLWGLFYLRAVCPVGLTSPICLLGNWNRSFHLLTRSIGFNMETKSGIMTSWMQAYRSEISVTVPYMVCTIFWIVGIVAIFSFVIWKQRNVEKSLKDATLLFDRVYQSEIVPVPVRIGFFRTKIYLPNHLSARETKNILLHQQMHGKRKDDLLRLIVLIISCIHWWNPFIWLAWYLSGVDTETACDEAVVKEIGWDQKELYAQDIINMKKEGSGAILPFALFVENRLERRAEHIIYLEKSSVWKKGLVAFLLTVCFFGWFGLSAFYNTWNGGTWETAETSQEEPLFEEPEKKTITNEVIAKCETKNPKDEVVDLELIMTQGSYQNGVGYTGQCMLRMKDVHGEITDTILLSDVFKGKRQQEFNENITLTLEDYNEDGVMELSLGQKAELTKKELAEVTSGGAIAIGNKPLQMYYLIAVQEEGLQVISEPVYVSGVTQLQMGSMVFSYVQGAKGVITATLGEEITCYVWDKEKKMYSRQIISQEEIDARKLPEEEPIEAGEKNRHILEDAGQTIMAEVRTETDDTGKEWIRKLKIYPDTEGEKAKNFKDIEGYYRSLDWVTMAEEEAEGFRYAVLGYGDVKGQGFILYDVKEQKEIYRQAKDYQILEGILKDFDDSEITFAQESAVVYSIIEMQDEDNIIIGFAADAGDGILIAGRYDYVISTGEISNLTYTRELEE